MNRKEIAIATLTWARDAAEESLLRQSLQQLAALDVPVYVTDGGSGTAFLDFLHSFPRFTVTPAPAQDVWPQAKNSLSAAHQSGAPFLFYTEPDKQDFFQNGLPRMLSEVTVTEQTGVVLAARSEAGFSSFPSFQQMTETTINRCCAEVTGKAYEYTYGPFLLHRQLIPHLESLPEDIGWGWRPYAFVLAHRLGYRIDAFAGDFFCPADQREDSAAERIYRMRQLSQNIQGIVLATQAAVKKEMLSQPSNHS